MTVYVQTKPHAPDAYHLWADTPDVLASLADWRRQGLDGGGGSE
jgi:hypothetical protein